MNPEALTAPPCFADYSKNPALIVTAADLVDGEYVGQPLSNVTGNLSFEKDLGNVWVASQVRCSGSLTIGRGTTLHAADTVEVGWSVAGKGSLAVSTGRIIAHGIDLGGSLNADLGIKTTAAILVAGDLIAGDTLEAGACIVVGGNLQVAADLDCKSGDVHIKGRAAVRTGLEARNIKVGGDASCWWLEASGRVIVGGNLSVKEDIRAGKSITVGGIIKAGWRVFAGLMSGRRVQRQDELIHCTALASGKIACGELVLVDAH